MIIFFLFQKLKLLFVIAKRYLSKWMKFILLASKGEFENNFFLLYFCSLEDKTKLQNQNLNEKFTACN